MAPTVIEGLAPIVARTRKRFLAQSSRCAHLTRKKRRWRWPTTRAMGWPRQCGPQFEARPPWPRIESGIVWVNTWLLRDLRTPFGGVKASGLDGRVAEAFEFFTEPQNICIKL